MDYGNTEITRMHLYPRRRNVAVQVAEELKTVTYATPYNYGGTQSEENRCWWVFFVPQDSWCVTVTISTLHCDVADVHAAVKFIVMLSWRGSGVSRSKSKGVKIRKQFLISCLGVSFEGKCVNCQCT